MRKAKRFLIIPVVMVLLLCAGCSGLDAFSNNLRGGAEQLSKDITIGQSKALIMPYQSFSGTRTADGDHFSAVYNADVTGFDGQDILVGNTDLKKSSCREVTISYSFDTEAGKCKLVYIGADLDEKVLSDGNSGTATVTLETGANYIGLVGDSFQGHIEVTVQ